MQCSRAVKKEQRSLIQHKPPKDTPLSDGERCKDTGHCAERSHLHHRTRKRAERKMTVYAFDSFKKTNSRRSRR